MDIRVVRRRRAASSIPDYKLRGRDALARQPNVSVDATTAFHKRRGEWSLAASQSQPLLLPRAQAAASGPKPVPSPLGGARIRQHRPFADAGGRAPSSEEAVGVAAPRSQLVADASGSPPDGGDSIPVDASPSRGIRRNRPHTAVGGREPQPRASARPSSASTWRRTGGFALTSPPQGRLKPTLAADLPQAAHRSKADAPAPAPAAPANGRALSPTSPTSPSRTTAKSPAGRRRGLPPREELTPARVGSVARGEAPAPITHAATQSHARATSARARAVTGPNVAWRPPPRDRGGVLGPRYGRESTHQDQDSQRQSMVRAQSAGTLRRPATAGAGAGQRGEASVREAPPSTPAAAAAAAGFGPFLRLPSRIPSERTSALALQQQVSVVMSRLADQERVGQDVSIQRAALQLEVLGAVGRSTPAFAGLLAGARAELGSWVPLRSEVAPGTVPRPVARPPRKSRRSGKGSSSSSSSSSSVPPAGSSASTPPAGSSPLEGAVAQNGMTRQEGAALAEAVMRVRAAEERRWEDTVAEMRAQLTAREEELVFLQEEVGRLRRAVATVRPSSALPRSRADVGDAAHAE